MELAPHRRDTLKIDVACPNSDLHSVSIETNIYISYTSWPFVQRCSWVLALTNVRLGDNFVDLAGRGFENVRSFGLIIVVVPPQRLSDRILFHCDMLVDARRIPPDRRCGITLVLKR